MNQKLTGVVSVESTLHGEINSRETMDGALSIPKRLPEYEKWDGPHKFTSDVAETVTYETKDKVMKDNIVVLKVPYYEVSNEKGTTVYIGKDQYNG